jgi:pyridoxine 5-phosphate synthase
LLYDDFSLILYPRPMTKLSVNLNKVALLRNSRGIDIPDVVNEGRICIAAGAQGLTVHPRPDQRHTKPSDVFALANLVNETPNIEFNIEGNPYPEFLELVQKARPTQCTLVPDDPNQLTSDHGWDMIKEGERLIPLIRELHDSDIRVSVFMDPVLDQIEKACAIGADRIELYTQPYDEAYGGAEGENVFSQFAQAAKHAQGLGLGVNAGHDLNLDNLGKFLTIPNILEVSIGHALIADALHYGLETAVKMYLKITEAAEDDIVAA